MHGWIYIAEAPSNAACALFRSYACQLVNYAVKASVAISTEYATLLHGQSGGHLIYVQYMYKCNSAYVNSSTHHAAYISIEVYMYEISLSCIIQCVNQEHTCILL